MPKRIGRNSSGCRNIMVLSRTIKARTEIIAMTTNNSIKVQSEAVES
jgi:hypothetical protein